MGGSHSQLSPSKSAIWGFCYGALAYAARSNVKPGPSNIHSASGTLTHTIAECLLRVHANGNDGADVEEFKGYDVGTKHKVDGFDFTVDEDRLARVYAYVTAIIARGGDQYYEVTLNLDPVLLTEGESGTADTLIIQAEELALEVHDLKDGNGVVLAKDNDQGICYLLGAWKENELICDFQKFRFYIHQPKVRNEPDMVEYTREEMEGHLKRLRYAASRNMELLHKDMTMPKIISALNPSDKACHWCPMAPTCVARSKQISEQFPSVTQSPSQLTPEDIGRFLTAEAAITAWFSRLRGEALSLAKQGTIIPGFKLTTGREGPRKWADETVAEEAMYEAIESAIWKKTLISPTDAQKKLLKKFPLVWEALQSNIVRSEGSISLVPESDLRAPLPLDVPEFANVTESGDDLL